MKTTIIALFTLSLAVFSTKNNTSDCYDIVNSESLCTTAEVINVPNEVLEPGDCYDVYFDPAIYNAASIEGFKLVYFRQQNWYAHPNQPVNYPFHQIWCAGEIGAPDGEESENLPPGVIVTPKGNNQG